MTGRRAFIAAASLLVAGCSSNVTSTPPTSPAAHVASTTNLTTPSTSPSSTSVTTAGASSVPIDPDEPIAADQLSPAPTQLGLRFATSDEPLPAQTTAALHDAGGQALGVDEALSSFGLFGIPRPSGANSAVMELDVTATRLAGIDGTSLSTEVLYMVASDERIEDLLDEAAATILPADTTWTPVSVPDYDGTTGDPRCARLPVDAPSPATVSVEGCEYRADPLTAVRSIGVRRLNLLVAGPPILPPMFADIPSVLLDAGELSGFTATFGRPSGPSGNTVQLTAQVHLAGGLGELGGEWQADGPDRWWSARATITVDAGTATWRSSTRASA